MSINSTSTAQDKANTEAAMSLNALSSTVGRSGQEVPSVPERLNRHEWMTMVVSPSQERSGRNARFAQTTRIRRKVAF